MEGKTQEAAAAAAGMSVRTARTWQRGLLPSEQKGPRIWRTRPDPFAAVWSEGIEPLLQRDPAGALQATTILEWLEQQYPGRFGLAQLRTLQRRVRDWRALHGPEQEVFFPQEHPPGREAQVDFTHGKELGITIAGQPFPHLFFELVLSYSGWRWVCGSGLRGDLRSPPQRDSRRLMGPGRCTRSGAQRQPFRGNPRT